MKPGMRTILIGLTVLTIVLAGLGAPRPAEAWRHGGGFGPSVGAPWIGAPWVFSAPRPYLDYRYSLPPGAPLSTYDPASGTTSCYSQTTGFYYPCGYGPTSAPAPPAFAPVPASAIALPGAPASGLLLFRLPAGTAVMVDGVPIGLSDGLGAISIAPGPHRVLLQAAGQDTERSVTVLPSRIFTVTPTAITPNEP